MTTLIAAAKESTNLQSTQFRVNRIHNWSVIFEVKYLFQ